MKGGEPKSMQSSSSTRRVLSSSGTTAQPVRQPVIACDFERLEMPAMRCSAPSTASTLACFWPPKSSEP